MQRWHIGEPKTQLSEELWQYNAAVINQQKPRLPDIDSTASQTIARRPPVRHGGNIPAHSYICTCAGGEKKGKKTQMFRGLTQRVKLADYQSVISEQPLLGCNWSAVDLQPKLVSVTAEIITQ